jgi:hypothetical protein
MSKRHADRQSERDTHKDRDQLKIKTNKRSKVTKNCIFREFRFQFRLEWFSIINNLIILFNNN